MEQATWKLADNSILYIEMSDGERYFPNSKEIFLSEFKSRSPFKNLKVQAPSSNIETLKFSKYPLQLRLQAI